MAAKTYRLANSNAPNGGTFLDLLESDQGAATLSTGWTLGKTATTLDSPMVNGTEQGTGTFSLESGSPKPGTPSSNNGFRSDTPLTGEFDLAAWSFTIAFRSVTTAYSGTIRARVRVFKSANADGTGATELTGSTQIGTTSGVGSTTVDSTSVVTWTPASSPLFNNEYLFITIACEIVTASGSNTADALLRTGTSSTGTFIVTGNFSVAEKNVPKKPQPLVRLNLKTRKPFLPHNNILVPDVTKRQTVTLAGGVIVDNILPTTLPLPTINRLNPVQGDGRAYPDSSFGIWRGATNLIVNGGFETDNTNWTQLTRTTSQSKFGSSSGYYDLGASSSTSITTDANITGIASSTAYTFSTWVYCPTGTNVTVRCTISEFTSGGVFIDNIDTTGDINCSSGWTRVTLNLTTSSTTAQLLPIILITNLDDSTRRFYVDGIQLEQQSYATPYIETNGATASRDPSYILLPNQITSISQGWLATRVRVETLDINNKSFIFSATDLAQATNFYEIYLDPANNQIAFTSGVGAQSTITVPFTPTIGTTHTIVIKWDSSNIYLSVDGGAFVSGSQPGATSWILAFLFIGCDAAFSEQFNGEFLWVASGTGTLSDADAASIDARGDTDDRTNWPSLSAATFFWACSNDEWVVPSLATGVAYAESATVSSVTSPSSSDVAAFVDQNTVGSTTTPSATETSQFVDSDTPSSVTSVTSVDVSTRNVATPRPLLIGLKRTALKLLGMNILNPADSVRVQYTDAATVNGVSSVQSTESTNFLDSGGTIQGSSSVTSTELAAYVDANTITGSTAPSATDVAADVDADTISSATSLSVVETSDFVDSDTPTSITSVLYQEQIIPQAAIPRPLLIALERGLLKLLKNNILNPDQIVIAVVIYTDSATISSSTSVQSTETTDFLDTSGAIQGTSSVASTEVSAYVDANTVAGASSPSAVETTQYVDSATTTGTTTVASTDVAAYVDTTTANGVTTPSAVDVSDFVDADTCSSVTSLTSQDQQVGYPNIPHPVLIRFMRRGFLLLHNNILNPDDSVRVIYVDAATIASVTTPSTVDTYQAVDNNTGTTVTVVTSAETYQGTDANTISTTTDPSGSTDVYAAVDSTTVSGVTAVSQLEEHDIPDSGTGSTTTVITSADVAAYVDSDTPASVTTPSAVDTADFVDTASVTSITSVISFEQVTPGAPSLPPMLIKLVRFRKMHLLNQHVPPAQNVVTNFDADTVGGTTTLSAVEIAQYVDSATASVVTTPSSVDTTDYSDSKTCSGTTSVSTTDTEQSQDADTTSSTTQPTSTDFAAYVDAGTTSSTTSVSAVEIRSYTDANTGATTTTVAYTETAAYVDAQTATGITSISSQDVVTDVDRDSVPGSSTINSAEVAFYVDTSTLNTVTSVTFDEIYSHGNNDADTISSTTSVIYIEERPFVDSSTIAGLSYVIYSDISQYSDIATVTSRSTVVVLEVEFFVELVGTAVTHFHLEVDTHYSATSTKHFIYRSDNHYSCKAVSKLVTT